MTTNLSFRSLSDAEGTLVELQNILASYELSLNPRKTKIHELRRALGTDSWSPFTEEQFQIRDGSAVQQRNDIIALFSLAFELEATIREKPVLRYAVARVRGLTVGRIAAARTSKLPIGSCHHRAVHRSGFYIRLCSRLRLRAIRMSHSRLSQRCPGDRNPDHIRSRARQRGGMGALESALAWTSEDESHGRNCRECHG